MITVWVADNQEKVKEILFDMLSKEGNVSLYITKQAATVRIAQQEDIRNLVSLEDKVIQMQEALRADKRGQVHKIILEAVEKPLFERILEYTEGNQLKAAKILGVNRNTLRTKIRKLGINALTWKT